MPMQKLNQHHEYSKRILPQRLDVIRNIHDDEKFLDSELGKKLTGLWHLRHDIRTSAPEELHTHIKEGSRHEMLRLEFYQQVMGLSKEAEYLMNVVKAINNESHDCKFFGHFIENLQEYIKHVDDDKLKLKLKEHEHLLRTIYHKEELEHFSNVVHKENSIELLKQKFGHERTGSALYHFVESETTGIGWKERLFGEKLKEEKLDEVASLLNKRISWLNTWARFRAHRIVKGKIGEINKKWGKAKKKSLKALEHGAKFHKKLDELHEEFGE